LLKWSRYHAAPGWRDGAALAIVILIILLLGLGARQMVGPFSATEQPEISISSLVLPYYALRTTMRMFAALAASLLFTFTYATLAAKSRHAEIVLIPLLDVLQSVPVLGYLSFTVVFFMSLFPNNTLGPELAAIFAIFTSQAWNMAFSFYQSLRTIPTDIDEASRSFRFSSWQRFWRLEVPFAMPGLIWNTMMSMSGGWFFVVASEAVSVGDLQFALPGIGSYVAKAIENRDLFAVGYAIAAMAATIVLYDQLLFRHRGGLGRQISLRTGGRPGCFSKLGARSFPTDEGLERTVCADRLAPRLHRSRALGCSVDPAGLARFKAFHARDRRPVVRRPRSRRRLSHPRAATFRRADVVDG